MAVFKCKMCGGELHIEGTDKVATCEYCGTAQTVPSADSEKKLTLFNRANRLRMLSEFDKAAALYEQLVAEFPEEAEAYWGLCLCNYGIEYVDDPATGQKKPTCHRASFEKLSADENFKLAMEYADVVAQQVYRDEAREIDRINEEILALSRNEAPYDVFICYKETDDAGNRTPESVLSQDIYEALTAKGFKVFFSRVTLEDKLGMQYEPYIFAALNSAKVMLCVGTRYEYFHAVWVRNEWGRFLRLAAKDKRKVLIPCYKDMNPYDLPDEFKGLQAQDLGKLGALQDLTRGVEKILAKPAPAAKAAPVQAVPIGGAPITKESLLKRAYAFLEDGDWQNAAAYAEKVLDVDVETAEAHLVKLMAEAHAHNRAELKKCPASFENSVNYQKAMRYGDEALKTELAETLRFIADRNETARRDGIYQQAVQKMNSPALEAELDEASAMLRSIAGHKDADALAAQLDEKEYRTYKCAEIKMQNAITAEAFAEAAEIFRSIPDYKDAGAKEKQCENERSKLMTLQAVGEAQRKKRKRILRISAIAAAVVFVLIGIIDWSNKSTNKKPVALEDARVGDIVIFGSYEQDNDTSNGKEAIEWQVLAKEGNRLLVVSRYALDRQKYNTSWYDVTWETCSLRSWLNGTFLNAAFSAEEQKKIPTVTVTADKNPSYGTDPGKDTNDKVFLLSITEANKYFSSDKEWICGATDYAKAQGVYTSTSFSAGGKAACWWWLRSPGGNSYSAACVDYFGDVNDYGYGVENDDDAVRPALWIDVG